VPPEHTDGALDALPSDLASRLRFVLEADALKTILRRNSIVSGTRLENSAEHSWHLAVMALVLAPYSKEPIDLGRVVSMLRVHDLVEIDAGDTFVYDISARLQQEAAETAAAERLFGMFAGGDEMRALWDEFEARATPEARFARAIDRLEPLLLNHANRGEPWRQHGVHADQVRALNSLIADGSDDLWNAARELMDDAVERGWLPTSEDRSAQ
jgi:putative hydrolases of HD superfamily